MIVINFNFKDLILNYGKIFELKIEMFNLTFWHINFRGNEKNELIIVKHEIMIQQFVILELKDI